MLTNLFTPLIQALGAWPFGLLARLAGVYEACGLKFAAAGILGTALLFCVLKQIAAIGGPIPLTPAVVVGLGLWLAFLTVALAHTWGDAVRVVAGERLI